MLQVGDQFPDLLLAEGTTPRRHHVSTLAAVRDGSEFFFCREVCSSFEVWCSPADAFETMTIAGADLVETPAPSIDASLVRQVELSGSLVGCLSLILCGSLAFYGRRGDCAAVDCSCCQ